MPQPANNSIFAPPPRGRQNEICTPLKMLEELCTPLKGGEGVSPGYPLPAVVDVVQEVKRRDFTKLFEKFKELVFGELCVDVADPNLDVGVAVVAVVPRVGHYQLVTSSRSPCSHTWCT